MPAMTNFIGVLKARIGLLSGDKNKTKHVAESLTAMSPRVNKKTSAWQASKKPRRRQSRRIYLIDSLRNGFGASSERNSGK
jgi:hypothetical protein